MNRKALIPIAGVVALAAAFVLAACGGSESGSESVALPREPAAAGEIEQKAVGETPLVAADTVGSVASDGNSPGLVPSQAVAYDRKIIQDTSLDLQVSDVTKSYNDVERVALTAGGFVLDSSFSGSEDEPFATITIRVPTAQYQKVVDDLRALAIKVENQTSKAQDVTQEYTDLQARLRSLQALEATYIGLLDKAESIDDILKIQSYLTPVRTEIEQIQGQLNVIDNLSSLATITVNLRTDTATPTPTPQPAKHPDPLKAGGAGWEGSLLFLRAVGAGLFAAATFLWWLVPILVIVGVGFLLRYRTTRNSGGTS